MLKLDLNGCIEPYSYEGKIGDPYFGAIMNRFHRAVYEIGCDERVLVTFDRLKDSGIYKAIDVSELIVSGVRLDEQLINFHTSSINKCEIFTTKPLSEQIKSNLLYSYLLQTSFCYVEFDGVNGTQGLVITQCYELLKDFGVDDWSVGPALSEIESGVFYVFRVEEHLNKIEKMVVDLSDINHFTTLYALINLKRKLLYELYDGNHEIVFVQDKNTRSIITSRDSEILWSKWVGKENLTDDINVKFETEENFAERFSIAIPNLMVTDDFLLVPIFEIKGLLKVTP
jgi:hypothetical protein